MFAKQRRQKFRYWEAGVSMNGSTTRNSSPRGPKASRGPVPACLLLILLCSFSALSQQSTPPAHQYSMQTVHEFQNLANAEAGPAYVVELDGVVTYSDPQWGAFFFHDTTGSLYIDVHGTTIRYPFGTRVHISGETSPGPVYPYITHPNIKVLGRGKPPLPERRSLEELNNKKSEGQFVETEGVLEPCDTNIDRVCYFISDKGAKAWLVLQAPESAASHRLIGATVKVKGVSGSHYAKDGNRDSALIYLNQFSDIQVLKPGPSASIPIRRHLPLQLESVHEVESLSNAQARQALPVELEGVVTYSDPEWGLLFIKDSTGSIYINVHGTSALYPSGTSVLVDGITGAGDTKPVVVHPEIQVIGHGLPVKPIQKSVTELNSRAADSQVVSTQGVLRACDKTWTRICFRIVDGNATAWVVAPHADSPAAQLLIGSTVRVRGVSGVHLDAANRPVAAQLFANGLEDIEVLDPASKDPFSSSPTPIGSLRLTYADGRFVHALHVRGTVTWESAGRFMIQDGSGAISGETASAAFLQAGRVVDVVGFPCHGELSGLMLSDSTVRVAPTQGNGVIVPLDVTAAEVTTRSFSGWRVRLTARLISQKTNSTQVEYLLEDGKQRFTAVLSNKRDSREVVGLSGDALLQLTGVAVIRNRSPEQPESFQLLIESPSDMVVLSQTGWFTFRHVLSILGLMGVCVIATVIWIAMLRRTVRKQTAINRVRLENELQLETRYRRLFERNLAAVFRWRPDGVIVDYNMAFVKMLGLQTHEELTGRSFWDFHANPEQREQIRQISHEDTLRNYETILRRDDGALVYLLVNISPVQTPEGMVYETTAIDVTQQRHHQAELQKAKDAAVHDSLNDPLTGLPNRRMISIRLASLFAEAKMTDSIIGLLYLDLDGFKAINDTHGHGVGDAVLIHVANQLRSRVRQEDVVARLGGDEFMVILGNLHEREEAVRVGKTLLETLSSPFMVGDREVAVSGSIGISVYPESAHDAEELMKQADSAMYAAKREGKNRLMRFTPEIGSLFHERMTLENQLRGAVQRNEISIHYQPEFELFGSRLTRFEALARWTHPELGSIPPGKFIPIAEESGLIVGLGAYIMRKACMDAVTWRKTLPYPIQVAVNVSNIQFCRRGFVEEVSAVLEETGLPPELLQIELTESVMMKDPDDSTVIMNRLHDLGVGLAIDDFGTGYSCLSYLPLLPFDALKIDSSFVRGLGTRPESESMVHTLIMLAHNIGMLVIVEGVETLEQLRMLRKLGADEVQGFFMGRPSAHPEDLITRLAEEVLVNEEMRIEDRAASQVRASS